MYAWAYDAENNWLYKFVENNVEIIGCLQELLGTNMAESNYITSNIKLMINTKAALQFLKGVEEWLW